MDAEPLYIISVVSRILRMHPQTLRKYERAGLVQPSRSEGMLRLYSDDDVRRLRLIKHLVDDVGLNLAGVDLVLRLREGLAQIRALARRGDAGARRLIEAESETLLTALEEFGLR